MLDVAIIGGGVAGCYCAYRLSADGPAHGQIALFEASGRIGGRLWSVPLADASGAVAEIGGMFFRSNQRNVSGLIEHLGLASDPVVFTRAGQFIRGAFFSDAEFASLRLPFKLNAEEQVSGPAALLLHALTKIVPGAADLWPINRRAPASAQATFDHLRLVRHRSRPLEEYGLWNVLADVVSNEAYALLTSVLGSVSMLRNVSAFDGVWSLLHEIGDGAGHTIRDGYQALPIQLCDRAKKCGVTVGMHHRLSTISRDGPGFRLSFVDGAGDAVEIQTRQVILALPQRALQRITFSSDLFEDAGAFYEARDRSVLPMRSCKIFLTYDRAWWNETAPNEVAATYTDLPIQQYYRWRGDIANGPALLMGAYADDVSASFWTPLAHARDGFASAAVDVSDVTRLEAPVALVDAARDQLAAIRAGDCPPTPRGALYFDWGSEPFGAAWHGWAPHFKSWDIRPFMRRPNPHLDLFICGEAYSQRNGWVEGALNSAELALEQFGLTRPHWINDPDFQLEVGDRGVGNDDSDTSDVQRIVARHGAAA